MKKTITILLITASLFCDAQDSLITYTDVIQIQGATKDQLFLKARQWFNEMFNATSEDVKVSDKELGEFFGKATKRLKVKHKLAIGHETKGMDYYFVVSIWTKDGKYKYEISNIQCRQAVGWSRMGALVTLTSSDKSPNRIALNGGKFADDLWDAMKETCDEYFKELAMNLKAAMNNKNDKSNF